MPLTDALGQGVQYPTLTDKPNAQTIGQNLVDGMVPRLVMRFPSAVVRGATIAVPAAGMVSWLTDVKRLEVHDGNGWVTVGSGATAWTNVSLDSEWTNNGNSQGNFQYRVVNLFGEQTIMFRGGIDRNGGFYPGSLPGFFKINSTNLPTNARPTTLRTVVVPCSGTGSERITMKLDILPIGELRIYGIVTGSTPSWIGFNGVFASL